MLLLRIERYLRATKMAPTRFGRNAVGDPWLVDDMRKGRILRDRTVARVNAHLDLVEAGKAETRPCDVVAAAVGVRDTRSC
jgi:hypothetical protein